MLILNRNTFNPAEPGSLKASEKFESIGLFSRAEGTPFINYIKHKVLKRWQNAGVLLDYSACMSKIFSLPLITLLVYGSMIQTASAEGLEPCSAKEAMASKLSFNASHTKIDRWSQSPRKDFYFHWDPPYSPTVILTWDVEEPLSCELHLSIAGKKIVLNGSGPFFSPGTTTFELKHDQKPGGVNPKSVTLATKQVTVSGDPGFITVSDGKEITADDINKFDAQWMQPYHREGALDWARRHLFLRHDAAMWEISERMAALARMAEVTSRIVDAKDEEHSRLKKFYLDHLQELIKIALMFRDDHHPGGKEATCEILKDICQKLPDKTDQGLPTTDEVLPKNPLDEFRGQNGLPAWGGKSVNSGNLHGVNEISFGYAYPIAAFARIVAEDPTLHSQYGDKALEYTNEVIKTVQIFMQQLVLGHTEAHLKGLDIHRTKPTKKQCEDAYNFVYDHLQEWERNDKVGMDRLEQMKRNCLTEYKVAGSAMAHNWNQFFMMVLIELWQVLDSPLYRNSSNSVSVADQLRKEIPIIVSRQHRYFVKRLKTDSGRFVWNYNDDLPKSVKTHFEDTSHGALDMRGLEMLRSNFDRLNKVAVLAGESILLDDSHLKRFANTFLQKIANGRNFALNVVGRSADPVDTYNGSCDGWMNLAIVDDRVYHKCHETSLRIVDNGQPYLTISAHSALIMNKRWLKSKIQPPKKQNLMPMFHLLLN